MRLLMVHPYGLGDMVLLTPLVRLLQEYDDDLRIDYLIMQPAAAEPIRRCDVTGRVITASLTPASLAKAVKTVRRIRYDAAWVSAGVNPLKAHALLSLLKAQRKALAPERVDLPHLPPAWRRHFTWRNLALARHLFQLPKTPPPPRFCLSGPPAAAQKGLIGIHPGSHPGYAAKRWGVTRYIILIEKLLRSGRRVRLFAGPAEREEARALRDYFGDSVAFVTGSLEEVARQIAACELFIHNDSGLGHVASCFGCKILTLNADAGARAFAQTEILSKRNTTLHLRTLPPKDDAQADAVFGVAERILSCAE